MKGRAQMEKFYPIGLKCTSDNHRWSCRYAAVLAAMPIFLPAAGICYAGCPNEQSKLDRRAGQAADAFNNADAQAAARKRESL